MENPSLVLLVLVFPSKLYLAEEYGWVGERLFYGVENIHQCFKKGRLRGNLVPLKIMFSIKCPALKHPVCLDPLKDFLKMDHTFRLTSGFTQTWKCWKSVFY